MTIAVTGSNGAIGTHLLQQLHQKGVDVRGLTRKDGAYSETAALTQSLSGTDTLFLVSARESANRVAEHISAVDAAVAAGVKHIVYLSFYGAAPDCAFTFGRDHFHTEQYIRSTGLHFTFLRDNFYQGILPYFADASGVIRGPGGDGKLSAVSSRDVVDVAAAVLLDADNHGDSYRGSTFHLTGPANLTFDQIAAELTAVTGRQIRYERETVQEAYASRAPYNAPAFEVDGWVSTYTAVALGECAGVSLDVMAITRRKPQSFASYLASNPASWAHLRL
jgi:NAD(P)H dehydrogenase (quinone)